MIYSSMPNILLILVKCKLDIGFSSAKLGAKHMFKCMLRCNNLVFIKVINSCDNH